jgi:hypothetical protein
MAVRAFERPRQPVARPVRELMPRPPSSSSRLAKAFNVPLTLALESLNAAAARQQSLHSESGQLIDDRELDAATARLFQQVDRALRAANASIHPESQELAPGLPKEFVVDAQTYNYYKIVVAPLCRTQCFKLTLEALKGDPDLYMCMEEFPTEQRHTWKSAGDGNDTIVVHAPHSATVYYVGVFGYYYSEYRITATFEDEVVRRETGAYKKETPAESVNLQIEHLRCVWAWVSWRVLAWQRHFCHHSTRASPMFDPHLGAPDDLILVAAGRAVVWILPCPTLCAMCAPVTV